MTRTQRNIAATWIPALRQVRAVQRLDELRALDLARYLSDDERAEQRGLMRGMAGGRNAESEVSCH